MQPKTSADLLKWYADNGRDLPWRRTDDPYSIWVSEIMLQQTQVETVMPYYDQFMRRFPTIEALAGAPLEAVLKLWEGLGYYARARNLHRAAQIILDEYGGRLPDTEVELRKLPGIGSYTASALAAIAFGRDTLALEANLRRVLSRLFDLHLDPRKPQGERELRSLGSALLPEGKASEFNQALMDLGATICTPLSPNCAACPLQTHCLGLRRGTQEDLPVRSPTKSSPHRQAVAAVIWLDDQVLIKQNASDGLLGGLWSFPGGLVNEGEGQDAALERIVKQQLGISVEVGSSLPRLRHSYTHYRLTLQPFECRIGSASRLVRDSGNCRWIARSEVDEVAMGKLDRMLAGSLLEPSKDNPNQHA